jgi:hypothetical protein
MPPLTEFHEDSLLGAPELWKLAGLPSIDLQTRRGRMMHLASPYRLVRINRINVEDSRIIEDLLFERVSDEALSEMPPCF